MGSADAADFDEDEVERPLDAVCARHPERRASIVCPYCGSYACGDCTVDTLWGDVMCDECRTHGRAQYPLPWEQGLSPIAFVHTAYLVFADTVSVFGALPSGNLRRPFGFAACVALLGALASGLTEWLFTARHWAARGPGLPEALARDGLRGALGSLLFIVFVALYFAGATRVFGGRVRVATALRGVCYLSAVDLLVTAGGIADTIVSGNTFTLLLGMAALFIVGWGLSVLAEQQGGLPRGKAIAAGASPVFALLLLGIALLAASAALG